MRKNLKLFPFRISTHHVLQQKDKEKRIEMCDWLNEKLEQTPSWLNHIWFSDEAHFHLSGAVNNRNNVFWGEEKPEEISEKRLKGPKVTAFVAFNQSTVCWDFTGSRKMGAPLPSTLSVISPFLISFTVT